MSKLNVDQKELLLDMMVSDTWPALLIMVDDIVEATGKQVLAMEAENEKLAIAKAKYDGARALANAIRVSKNQFKKIGRDNG